MEALNYMQENFNIKPITARDLDTLTKWYEAREKTPPAKELLPNTGYIVYNINSEMPIAAMWIYYTNSAVAMFEELITDPHSERIERGEAIDMLLNFSYDLIKLKGYKVVMALSSNTMLMDRLKRHGYSLVSEDLLQYVKIVNGGT
jgi:hypothetical protein